MKVKFIYPNDPKVNIIELRVFWYPLLTFPLLAAYTPDEHEIEIIDEIFETINFDEPVDLVSLTAMTFMAPRAYEIADEFRKRGIPVVMGGIHASALPQEALEHVDSVVIGEAELVWGKVLEDIKKRDLQPIYHSDIQFDMTQYRKPRLELLTKYFQEGKRYYPHGYNSLNTIEISRGCPFNCDFCSVSNYFGKSYRSRSIDDVINNIHELKLLFRDRFFNFNDDNLFGNRIYFIELLNRINKLNIKWIGQISSNVANDSNILKLMASSGCQLIFVGIESLSEESLKSVNKTVNRVEKYKPLMEQCEKNGIKVVVSIIFGLDGDDESIFKKTVDFVKQYSWIVPSYTLLTPFPGSKLYDRLKAENRIIDFDWRHYNLGHVTIKPKKMSIETLKEGHQWAMSQYKPYLMTADEVNKERKNVK